MPFTSGKMILALALLSAPPGGKWLGQDGHDLVGGPSEVTPSDVQDIHIVLGNLPPQNEIVSIQVLGYGGDEWRHPWRGPYAALLQRKPGSSVADLFFEPLRVETGRSFEIKLEFKDGTKTSLYVNGKRANPNLRMPAAALQIKWVGQDREDWVGPGVSVGPDGLQDVRLALSKLSPKIKVQSIDLEDASRQRWQFGTNPKGYHNAEFAPNEKDPTQGDFFFQPERDLNGQTLKLTVAYENGKSDSATLTAARVDTSLKMPPLKLPAVRFETVQSNWRGQEGSQIVGPGEVHVALSGLPAETVTAAMLSDSVRGNWTFGARDQGPIANESESKPFEFRRGPATGQADLYFEPNRDETGATMTLRMVLQSGGMVVVSFPGGACDPSRRGPAVAATATQAKPGDDLQDLVNRFGTVRLSRGTYPLSKPLVLNQPITVIGERGAVLNFSQAASDPPWTTAVKVHRGGTRLEGFAIRFTGPVRWNTEVSWGPAIIGQTDNLDANAPPGTRDDVIFRGLDIEIPPAANPKGAEFAVQTMRLIVGRRGVITGNTIRGGGIEVFDGPWHIEGNDFQGVPPGYFAYTMITAHNPHDLTVRGNRTRALGPSGKTWRFLVLTGQGVFDRIENNVINDVGPRDDDTIKGANAPEIILTESYRLGFEGKPAAVSTNGRVIRIRKPLGNPIKTGDIVAVLSGKAAGQWRRIAQTINATTYLLDGALPDGVNAIAITAGFANETIQKNQIIGRGATTAGGFVLAGNHFGTRLLDNQVIGVGAPALLSAFPTESPMIWGWSHVPFLDSTIAGNLFEDSDGGATLGVLHNNATKTNQGRVYMTIACRDNTVRWTAPFLARRRANGKPELPPGITLGYPDGLDPSELRVDARGNRLEAPLGTDGSKALVIKSAVYNGQTVVSKSFSLADTPSTARKE